MELGMVRGLLNKFIVSTRSWMTTVSFDEIKEESSHRNKL